MGVHLTCGGPNEITLAAMTPSNEMRARFHVLDDLDLVTLGDTGLGR